MNKLFIIFIFKKFLTYFNEEKVYTITNDKY